MRPPESLRSTRVALHALTFLVAFCSFAYELVYSELLTVAYGGAVVQYGLTVGLFFSSLGVGSFLSRDLDHDRPSNFFRMELYLAVVAPAGFLLVLALDAVQLPGFVPSVAVAVLARVPVVVVGLLSGFELPVLTSMVEREADGDVASPGLAAAGAAVRRHLRRLLGAFFHVSESRAEVDGYSTVLGMDYLGGLAGSLVYVFVLYPRLGLMPTIFVLGLLNGIAALLFVARFSDRGWGFLAGGPRRLASRERASLLVACLLVTGGYAGVAVNHGAVGDALTGFYVEEQVEADHPPGAVEASVVEGLTTRYQQVTLYDRTWTGAGDNPLFDGRTERCLRLGTAVQLCESWADSYHAGLVDVPMSMYPNGSDTRVLLVGGGDWVAVDHLREYGVTVDQVDVDREFMDWAREEPFLRKYHHDAFQYPRLNTTVADGYSYLASTDERYDLVLLDLPGAEDSDLLRLYSKEFYEMVRDHLTPGGTVATWTYSRYDQAAHHAAFVNTVRAAGFDRYLPYWAYDDVDADGDTERVERFYVLSPDRGPAFRVNSGGSYVHEYSDRYRDLRWRETPRYRGVAVNSVFDPNYDVLVDT